MIGLAPRSVARDGRCWRRKPQMGHASSKPSGLLISPAVNKRTRVGSRRGQWRAGLVVLLRASCLRICVLVLWLPDCACSLTFPVGTTLTQLGCRASRSAVLLGLLSFSSSRWQGLSSVRSPYPALVLASAGQLHDSQEASCQILWTRCYPQPTQLCPNLTSLWPGRAGYEPFRVKPGKFVS
ncbi:hypothetical protein B0T24DRAFT_230301 [Lasiosphaeria ovina]|uniref:Uncharacterized protein n=1 Tax=Lasiosphaeria ovina TaxID=92902 RepID=A0AAE0NBS5_9PEZI|nr:hypothetical protein B0T24DRAFT_230301 [Lasiosphaeria ovina]